MNISETIALAGLGIDAGGTQTRWALSGTGGVLIAEGQVAGLSALQMSSPAGRDSVRQLLSQLVREALRHGRPQRVCAGLTGFGGDGALLQQWLGELLGIASEAVTIRNDIEIAYLDNFAPGEGYLVYAGTGSIGAYIDADGQFHRAGGRGVTLDDGGGGFWIAREALRHIWRGEDEQPGRWQSSSMAQAVFEQIGGSDWNLSRQFIYHQERGAIGKLALAVAASAERDPVAAAILQEAGRELARLAQALLDRYGARPVALSGRAASLHPLIAESMRSSLPADAILTHTSNLAHIAAARLAARVY